MFLKKSSFFLFLLIYFFISNNIFSAEIDENKKIINYLNNLKNLSVSFIQSDGLNLSEGLIAVGEKRLRVEYHSPSKILIILDKNKGMYYNFDLDEDEFFNPKNTSAWYFYEVFQNPDFLKNSPVSSEDKNIVVEKEGNLEDENYKLRIYFEDEPMILRKVELILNEELISISFNNHEYNKNFEANYFKLINPNFFD